MMMDWNQYHKEIGGRLGDLMKLSPDTVRGYQMLSAAGSKTNHLNEKTRQLISLAGQHDGLALEQARAVLALTTVDEERALDVVELVRLWREKQVTMRSPRPLRPVKVSACAPQATPRRRISTIARVTSAALELSPKPSPSPMPAAIAITFFKAPPNSTPSKSEPA